MFTSKLPIKKEDNNTGEQSLKEMWQCRDFYNLLNKTTVLILYFSAKRKSMIDLMVHIKGLRFKSMDLI